MRKRSVLLILICLGLMAGREYDHSVPGDCFQFCGAMHRAVMAGTADSPYRYRVLSSFLVAPLAPDNTDGQIAVAYIIGHYVALILMMLALYRWFRCTLPQLAALIGVGVVALYLPMMFEIWGLSLNSIIDVIFLCTGLILLYRHGIPFGLPWEACFGALLFMAALNRETSVILLIAYFLLNRHDWREAAFWGWGACFAILWGGVIVGLRLALGLAPDNVPVAVAWAMNTSGGWWVGEEIGKLPLFLPVVILYLRYIRGARGRLRSLWPALALYMLSYLVFGYWHEVRLLLPALVLALPVIGAGLLGRVSGTVPGRLVFLSSSKMESPLISDEDIRKAVASVKGD